jgi:hypothetical protein
MIEEEYVSGMHLCTDFRLLPDRRMVAIGKNGEVDFPRTGGRWGACPATSSQ